MIDRRALLVSAGCAALVPAAAQTPLPNSGLFALSKQGLYLPQLHEMQSNPAQEGLLAQTRAMIGDEVGALASMGSPKMSPMPPDCHAEDALEAIVTAAKGRRVVFLNEAHNASLCRGFAEILALRLRAEGFTIFAAETFAPSCASGSAAAALNANAPITTDLGYYLRDPAYAEAVRSARKAGYSFATYEKRYDQASAQGASRGEQIAAREEAEANNFIEVLERNPQARVFVYCGYEHLTKAPSAKGVSWFATRLKAKTGIDPLSISQCWTIPASDPANDPAPLKAVLEAFSPRSPIVLRDGAGESVCFGWLKTRVDLEVIHPRLPKVAGRPGWLAAMPGRHKVRFRLPEATKGYALVQAVASDETVAPNVVPSDMYPIEIGTREAVFFLKRGHYEVRMETDEGRRVLGHLAV